MVPTILSDWTVPVIIELLTKEMFETDRFDYKQTLPHPSDNSGKERLRHTCCAFANSDGGFLVFGISDDRSKTPEQRIVGMESTVDFPQHFGNFPKNCFPPVDWDFLNPALVLDSGKVIHVVEIPKSWRAPHATGEHDKGWRFAKRTNQGSEGMSIDEIRGAFLGFYEKRLKLQLLRSELLNLKEAAAVAYIADETKIEERYSLVTFDLQIIESVIADTYSITAHDADLLNNLTEIRHTARIANNAIQLFFSVANTALTNKGKLIRAHNEHMLPNCEFLMAKCDEAMTRLDGLIGTKDET